MDRNASASVITELGAEQNFPVHLCEVYFDGETIYLTDAYRQVSWAGRIYISMGHLLGFGDIEETHELVVSNMSVSLSGVDQIYISKFLSVSYIDRQIKIYKAFLNTNTEAVIADPVLIFDGRMDQPVIAEDPDAGTSVVTVNCTNAWVDFERRPGRKTNHEEQQIWFPGDKGFEFASEITKEIKWGTA
jgi:hypothetical protein